MYKLQHISLLLIAIIIALSSCEKSETKEGVNPKITALSRKWRLTASVATYSYQAGSTDEYATMPNCEKDDYNEIKADGTYKIYSGVSKCSPTQTDVIDAGNWSLVDNDSKIKFQTNNSTNSITLELLAVSSTNYSTKLTQTFNFGIIYTTNTYTAIP